MKKIKAILCDVDGTLVNNNFQYLPEVNILIKKIQNKNIMFSLATGRAYYSSIKNIETELGIQGTHILFGGAMILDTIKNKILLCEPISNKSTEKIINYLLRQKLIFSLEGEKNVFVPINVKGSLRYQDAITRNLEEYNNKKKILKIVIFGRVNKLTEKTIIIHQKNIQKQCLDISTHRFNFFDFYGADITSIKATKHTAVLEYLKILNFFPDEVVAIGDGLNDYPLFTACGFKIAMGTAAKELKEISNLVVPSVQEGGMVEALKYIVKNFI